MLELTLSTHSLLKPMLRWQLRRLLLCAGQPAVPTPAQAPAAQRPSRAAQPVRSPAATRSAAAQAPERAAGLAAAQLARAAGVPQAASKPAAAAPTKRGPTRKPAFRQTPTSSQPSQPSSQPRSAAKAKAAAKPAPPAAAALTQEGFEQQCEEVLGSVEASTEAFRGAATWRARQKHALRLVSLAASLKQLVAQDPSKTAA